MLEVIIQPKECLHDSILWDRWHVAGAQILHMGRAGKDGISIVLFPAETSATFATDKSAAQRGGIHCMLNMLFASLPKQMLDSIIRLAVNNPRMGVGHVIIALQLMLDQGYRKRRLSSLE